MFSVAVAALATCVVAAGDASVDALAQDVDICAVLHNPFDYDHKLVRVSGLIARDFETFWIESPKCSDAHPVWIEYGGPRPADGIRWHEGPENPSDDSPLVIEGITTSLVVDRQFKRFDAITKNLKRRKRAQATLVGWIVSAGVAKSADGSEEEIGYGPYGEYSLFVIRKVESVSRK